MARKCGKRTLCAVGNALQNEHEQLIHSAGYAGPLEPGVREGLIARMHEVGRALRAHCAACAQSKGKP